MKIWPFFMLVEMMLLVEVIEMFLILVFQDLTDLLGQVCRVMKP